MRVRKMMTECSFLGELSLISEHIYLQMLFQGQEMYAGLMNTSMEKENHNHKENHSFFFHF